MLSFYDERGSESPFIESIWRASVDSDGSMLLPADGNWHMLVLKKDGKTSLSVQGPATKAYRLEQTAGSEWFGIRFKLSTFMPGLPPSKLVDATLVLPDASCNTFLLDGSTWQYPEHEDAETFVECLARADLLVREPALDTVIRDCP